LISSGVRQAFQTRFTVLLKASVLLKG